MSFKCIDSFTMSSEYTLISKYQGCSTPSTFSGDNANKKTVGGETIADKVAQDRITLIRESSKGMDDREYFKAFLGSSGYHIQIQNKSGDPDFQKFIVESGSYVYKKDGDQEQLVITGYISPTYKSQTTDR